MSPTQKVEQQSFDNSDKYKVENERLRNHLVQLEIRHHEELAALMEDIRKLKEEKEILTEKKNEGVKELEISLQNLQSVLDNYEETKRAENELLISSFNSRINEMRKLIMEKEKENFTLRKEINESNTHLKEEQKKCDELSKKVMNIIPKDPTDIQQSLLSSLLKRYFTTPEGSVKYEVLYILTKFAGWSDSERCDILKLRMDANGKFIIGNTEDCNKVRII